MNKHTPTPWTRAQHQEVIDRERILPPSPKHAGCIGLELGMHQECLTLIGQVDKLITNRDALLGVLVMARATASHLRSLIRIGGQSSITVLNGLEAAIAQAERGNA